METLRLLVLLLFANISANAQDVEAEGSRILTCDTTESLFFKRNVLVSDSLRDTAQMIFHLFEGDGYYTPAFSFLLWESKKVRRHQMIIDRTEDAAGRNSAAVLSDSIIRNINVDLIVAEAEAVQKIKSDTNSISSHNHLIRVRLFTKGRSVSFSICTDQLQRYLASQKKSSLRDLFGVVRELATR